MDLLPSWERDRRGPGTLSVEVRVPDRTDITTFTFLYGYDVPGAPRDREAYKKFLADEQVMKVTADRQRGAAWYLEGVDPEGHAMFRTLVIYGGKRLVCKGSLYRESTLGEQRDAVILQAKKICETLRL